MNDKIKVLTPVKAIRAKCLDCSNQQWSEVKRCSVVECALYPWRLGKRPKKDDNGNYIAVEEIEEEEKQTFTRAQRHEVNKLLRENPIDTYFDELALNPATVKAINKKNTRKALQTSHRARRSRRR